MSESTSTTLHVHDDSFTELIYEYLQENPENVTIESDQNTTDAIAELTETDDVDVIVNNESADRTDDRRNRDRHIEHRFLMSVIAEISHDLRSPLAVGQGHIELARETGDLSHLDAADDALTRAAERLDYLGKLAGEGKQTIDPEPSDLQTVAEEAWGMIETVEADLKVPANETVVADSQRLHQVFENLFRNAIEHGGANVTIRVGPLDNGFYVEDDGIGIPAGERDDVFEEGYSGDPNGSGLGLAICKQIADAHGWSITVTTGADGGVRIEISNVELEPT